jgi:hypothetical protein
MGHGLGLCNHRSKVRSCESQRASGSGGDREIPAMGHWGDLLREGEVVTCRAG